MRRLANDTVITVAIIEIIVGLIEILKATNAL